MKSSLLLAFEVVYKEAAVADDLPREAGSMGPLVAEGYKSDDPSSLGKTSGVDGSPRPLCWVTWNKILKLKTSNYRLKASNARFKALKCNLKFLNFFSKKESTYLNIEVEMLGK